MEQAEILENLKSFIGNEILDGEDIGLDDSTPLLEWGVLNSIEIARLVTFMQNRFNVKVPDNKIIPEYFKDLPSLTNLVVELSKG